MTTAPPADAGRRSHARFSKTVSESDVYGFGGITGDLARNHVDEAYMASTPYKHRIAHGVLLLGYASAASTQMMQEILGQHGVSYGYDRLRFTAPVYFGDTVTVTYTLERLDEEAQKAYSKVEVHNQDGVLCLVATHILKFFPVTGDGADEAPAQAAAGARPAGAGR